MQDGVCMAIGKKNRELKVTPPELRGERCSDVPGGSRSASPCCRSTEHLMCLVGEIEDKRERMCREINGQEV